jgi:F-type H+-transporting ATPase subunit delta
MTLLTRRYATALFLAAKAQNAVPRVEADLGAMHAGLQEGALQAMLLSPDVPGPERARVLQKLGAGKSPLVQNLLQVLLRRRRQEVLFDLQPAFRALCMQERGEIEGVVETPRPLAPDDVARLAQLAQQLSGRKCSLAVRVRPELIGGVRLLLGHVLYDGSVQSGLEQLEQRLLQVSV